jgi:hypothetical protein
MILTFIKSALSGVYGLRMESIWKAYGKLRVNQFAKIVNGSAGLTKTHPKINQTLMQATKAGAI